MTLTEVKRTIVKSFRKQFGFAPTMKSIRPMESCQCGENYVTLAFCIGKIGYSWKLGEEVERAEPYDL